VAIITKWTSKLTSKAQGDAGEAQALAHLLQQGLQLVRRNYRVARGPKARGGEIDLIMREADGTLVFVEVRQRSRSAEGGAAASIGALKRASVVFAAQHFLGALSTLPPCRFDVVAIDSGKVQWLRAAFDVS
jgi:putative endonuclease